MKGHLPAGGRCRVFVLRGLRCRCVPLHRTAPLTRVELSSFERPADTEAPPPPSALYADLADELLTRALDNVGQNPDSTGSQRAV
jgi:hypothetical protein